MRRTEAPGQAVPVIPAAWLIKKVSIAEAEADIRARATNGRNNILNSPGRSARSTPNGKL